MRGKIPSRAIKDKAISLGASLVGVAAGDAVLQTPSHREHPQMRHRFEHGTFIVMALAHPPSNPSLDWWDGRGGTAGNREMQRIGRSLQNWLKQTLDRAAHLLPYHVEKGGIFLKEAAAVSGVGVIGRNNLLITPHYGAGVRLRALYVESGMLEADSPSRFAPCEGCPAPCLKACPQKAFRSGRYQRPRCIIQMMKDEFRSKNEKAAGKVPAAVAYCRTCELVCPATRGAFRRVV